jgi:methionyl-tRNA formyltransferase
MTNSTIIFAGYRDWSSEVFEQIKNKHTNFDWFKAETPKQLEVLFNKVDNLAMILLSGWSWIIPNNIIESTTVLGLHPSDLPSYAGGSPIQNQILDGVIDTKMTLFKLNEKLDEGDILYQEKLSLAGHLNNIFSNMVDSSEKLICRLLKEYPNLEYKKQKNKGKKYKRILPNQSELTPNKLSNMSTTELYNFIRCREDPYPNAYIEDDFGKLYFKHVEFKKNDVIQIGIPCFSYEGDCESYVSFAINSMLSTAKNPEELEFIIGLNGDDIQIDRMSGLHDKIKFIDVIKEVQNRVGDTPHKTEYTSNSLNHGEVLDTLFNHFNTEYGMWVDADVAFLCKNWDEKLKNELNETCSVVGLTYPKNRNRYEDFPTIMVCMFKTEVMKKLNMSFATVNMGGVRNVPVLETESKFFNLKTGSTINLDSGEMLPLIQEHGYSGKCIHSVHLFQKDGELQFLDSELDEARRKSSVKGGNGKICEGQMNGEVILTHLSESRYRKYNEDPLSKVWLSKIKFWLKEKCGVDIEI